MKIRHSAVIFIVCLILITPSKIYSIEEEKDVYILKETEEKDALEEGAKNIKIETSYLPKDIFVGEIFTYKLVIKYPEKTKVYFPQAPLLSQSFSLIKHDRTIPVKKGGEKIETHSLSILPLRIGDIKFGGIEIPYIDENKEAGRVLTPEEKINIKRKLTDEGKLEFKKPQKTFFVLKKNTPLIISLSAIGVFALASLITLLVMKILRSRAEKLKPPPPPRPAYIIALERLQQIADEKFLSKGLIKLHYFAVSEVIREYIENLKNFPALEMTTSEILSFLNKSSLKGVPSSEMREFLQESDLVKFAKYVPSEDSQNRLLPWAIDIIKRSMPSPMELNNGK